MGLETPGKTTEQSFREYQHVSNEQKLKKYKKGRYVTNVLEESLNTSTEKKMEGGGTEARKSVRCQLQ